MQLRAALALLPWLAAACSAPIAASSAAIVDGTADTGDSAVVGVSLRRASCDATVGLLCTGTLIASRVVLTAAHCLVELEGQTGIELYFGADTTNDPNGTLMLAESSTVDPDYDDASGDNDLGLILLPRDAPVAPLALGDTPPPAGATVRVIGFGAVAAGGLPDGVKRTGTMTVASTDATTITLSPAPSNSCSGDSGGPVLAGAPGAEQLIGVTASGDAGCLTSAVAERVDGNAASFIAAFVASAAAAPDEPAVGSQDLSQICSAGCASDADCPVGLRCQPSPGGPARCVLPGHVPGALDESCLHDSDCGAGGMCARLDPDSCRCLRGCTKASGCAMSGSNASFYTFWIVCLFMVCAIFVRTSFRL